MEGLSIIVALAPMHTNWNHVTTKPAFDVRSAARWLMQRGSHIRVVRGCHSSTALPSFLSHFSDFSVMSRSRSSNRLPLHNGDLGPNRTRKLDHIPLATLPAVHTRATPDSRLIRYPAASGSVNTRSIGTQPSMGIPAPENLEIVKSDSDFFLTQIQTKLSECKLYVAYSRLEPTV